MNVYDDYFSKEYLRHQRRLRRIDILAVLACIAIVITSAAIWGRLGF